MNKIEHIGIAVKDLGVSKEVFEKLLNREAYKTEEVESEQVETLFFQLGESKLELLQATGADSAIAKYLEKNREGVHHVAIAVDDIHQEIERLENLGFNFILPEPKKGADNKLITFLHPKSTSGILVELCQDIMA